LLTKHSVRTQSAQFLNISLAPGSQKKINQLLLPCCATALIVKKETLLKKHNLLNTCRSFLTA